MKQKSGHPKRFHKITEFVVEKSSPQQPSSDQSPAEKEAEAIVKFRQARVQQRGKPLHENS
jgi:hypothetical protein